MPFSAKELVAFAVAANVWFPHSAYNLSKPPSVGPKSAFVVAPKSFAIAAKVSFPPILLKNSLLRLQISRNQKAVLRSSEHVPKYRKNFRSSEFYSIKFAWNAQHWSFSTEYTINAGFMPTQYFNCPILEPICSSSMNMPPADRKWTRLSAHQRSRPIHF
ncbi:MAG: hypothetical protein ABJQ34_01605 [Paracoccaceae bacterium]